MCSLEAPERSCGFELLILQNRLRILAFRGPNFQKTAANAAFGVAPLIGGLQKFPSTPAGRVGNRAAPSGAVAGIFQKFCVDSRRYRCDRIPVVLRTTPKPPKPSFRQKSVSWRWVHPSGAVFGLLFALKMLPTMCAKHKVSLNFFAVLGSLYGASDCPLGGFDPF